jgi:hypothetical protein
MYDLIIDDAFEGDSIALKVAVKNSDGTACDLTGIDPLLDLGGGVITEQTSGVSCIIDEIFGLITILISRVLVAALTDSEYMLSVGLDSGNGRIETLFKALVPLKPVYTS